MRKALLRQPGADETLEVVLERTSEARGEQHVAEIGDRHVPVEIESEDGRSGWVRMHGRVHRFHAHRKDGAVEVWVSGRRYEFDMVERTAQRASGVAAAGAVKAINAPMPGTVLKVNVKEGAAFEAHDPLIVVESMKMETSLSAPTAGRVARVLCNEGDLVEMNELLIELEADDADDAS